MSKNTLYRFLVFLILVVIVLALTWRNSADGQPSSTSIEPQTQASEMLNDMTKELRQRDLRVSYWYLGRVQNVRNTALYLVNRPQYYLKISGGRPTLLTLDWNNSIKGFVLREIESAISGDDLIYELEINGRVIGAVISADGSRYGGLFLMVSRIYSRNPDSRSVRGSCKNKVLSTDIFGRTAEEVSACCRASCTDGIVSDCWLEEVGSGHSYFGFVELDPNLSNVPRLGQVNGNFCRDRVRYTWGVRFRLPEWNVDIPGMGGTGFLIPETHCGS